MRGLTHEPPETFQGRLTEGCAAVGVAVVLVPELPKTAVSGAQKIGIAPGIVVGRLQREGVFAHHIGNKLKRRLCWSAL